MLGKEVRMKRLIPGKDGKYFGLTVDHSIGRGVLPGLDTIRTTLEKMVAGKPNCITMLKGIAENCWGPYAGVIPFSLKLTTFGVYHPNEDVLVADLDEAIKLGADAVSCGCIVGGDNQDQQIVQLARISKAAHNVGFPLICHIYPRGNHITDQFSVENVTYAARTAAELGVDIIKTHYTGSPESFAKVVQAVPARVAIAGGTSCKTVDEFLQMTHDVMASGAIGVTYGRFVFQYHNPTALIKTLSQIIHNDLPVKEAKDLLVDLEHE